MKRQFFLAMAVIILTFAYSCKPALKVSTDYDHNVNFGQYKTYGMYYLISSTNINPLNEERVWNYIRLEMAKKGYVENNTNPDLVVNALSVLKDKRYLSASGVYGRPYFAAPGYGTVRAYDYKEGSLVIDIVDRKSQKLVWEGIGQAEFEKRPKNPDAVIEESVKKILFAFPRAGMPVQP